jgi:CRP-like cAMP-binding protein
MNIFSEGRMVGDYECIKGIPYQSTVFCIDQKAIVYEIKKKDFLRLQDEQKADVWNGIVKASTRMNSELLKQYAEKLIAFQELKKRNNQANPDMKYICNHLMRETKFSLKKSEIRRTTLDNPQTVTI